VPEEVGWLGKKAVAIGNEKLGAVVYEVFVNSAAAADRG
jgi:hypothetical protein